MVNNWGLWGQDFAINSNGSIFHHRREIKIAHRQGERSQAECLKQIMVDISAAVLLRLWVQRSHTQVVPTLNVQNVTQHRAVQDSFFADDVVLRHVTSWNQRHHTLIVLSSHSSIAFSLPPLLFIASPHVTDFSFSSCLTLLLLSIIGGEEEGGKKDERSLSDDSFIRRAVQLQILIITLNYSQTAGLHCVGLNELSHAGTNVCVYWLWWLMLVSTRPYRAGITWQDRTPGWDWTTSCSTEIVVTLFMNYSLAVLNTAFLRPT